MNNLFTRTVATLDNNHNVRLNEGGWAINCERSLIWIFMGDNINVNVFS